MRGNPNELRKNEQSWLTKGGSPTQVRWIWMHATLVSACDIGPWTKAQDVLLFIAE